MSEEIKEWNVTWRDEEWNGYEDDYLCTESEIKNIVDMLNENNIDVNYKEIKE